METLKNILTNYKPDPSSQCWDKLSASLDAVMPPKVPKSGHASAQSFWTAGTKMIAAVVGTAVTATVVMVAISKFSPSSTPTKTTTPQNTTIYTDTLSQDTANQAVPAFNTLNCTSTKTPAENTNKASTNSATPKSPTTATPSTNLSMPSVAVGMTGNSNFMTPAPTRSNLPAPSSKPPKAIIPPAAQPATNTIADAHQDPAVQQLEDENNIEWNKPAKLEIPNVFTPNGDGINDFFVIIGLENCTKRQLTVRNIAGNIVYKSNSYENTWDGNDCPDGVYRYQFIFNNGNIDQSCTGNIYIKRK